jgi:hypothetical protein
MKRPFLIIASLALLMLSLDASAQTQTHDLARLYPGYAPTVFKGTADIFSLFKQMPTDFEAGKKSKSQCFQRAEIWTYDFTLNHQVSAMKVFIFYTHSYRDFKEAKGDDFDWWFHVAPYVLYEGANSTIKEAVLDPTFADKPMNMQAWSKLFVNSGKSCKEFVRFSEFADEVKDFTSKPSTEDCYLVRVPASDYDPIAVEARDSGSVTGYQFDLDEVAVAVENAPNPTLRKEIKNRLGL